MGDGQGRGEASEITAVIDIFKAVEEYNQERLDYNHYLTKKLELLDGSVLKVKQSRDEHFNDCEDCHAADYISVIVIFPKKVRNH